MALRSMRWRICLLGSDIDQWQLVRRYRLRSSPSSHHELIHIDVDRAFADDAWFDDHRATIEAILNSFAYTNAAIGYAQGFNFLCMPLFREFHATRPDHAVADTYFAMQKLVSVLRPLYPLHDKDLSSCYYVNSITALVSLRVQNTLRLPTDAAPIRLKDIVKSCVISWIPVMYANVFDDYEDVAEIWDFIFQHSSNRRILQSLMDILVEIFRLHQIIFQNLPVEKAWEVFLAAVPLSGQKLVIRLNNHTK